jgi:glutamyl-tRNA reductase
MNSLLLVGLNHRLAPVEIREKLAFSPERITSALHQIVARLPQQDSQAAILSTCNRSEVYIWTAEARLAAKQVVSFLAEHAGCDLEEITSKLYIQEDEAAGAARSQGAQEGNKMAPAPPSPAEANGGK